MAPGVEPLLFELFDEDFRVDLEGGGHADSLLAPLSENLIADILAMLGEGSGVANVFCSTGPGGGVDPSCSPGGKVTEEQLRSLVGGHDAGKKRLEEILKSPEASAILAHVPSGSKFLSAGREALVLESPVGEVIRIGKNVHRIDVPEILQPTRSIKVGDWTIEHLPKATEVGSSDIGVWKEIAALEKGLRAKGYLIHDLGPENVGKVNGKWVFIDPGEITKIPIKNVFCLTGEERP